MPKDMSKKQAKIGKVMSEFKAGQLHSGKPGPGKGPTVKSKKQALAIALRQAGVPKKGKRGKK
jgi:hypothetical protein